ncbi:hypothetical protein B0H13DRAFT_1851174 [Mycena leptocephala]|nr:hypothetical protein B0H13DRAFT_1851174 [Mycena leptocephala]
MSCRAKDSGHRSQEHRGNKGYQQIHKPEEQERGKGGRTTEMAGPVYNGKHSHGVFSVGVLAGNCKAVTENHSRRITSIGVPKSLITGWCFGVKTSIPALHEYTQLIGEFHNLTEGGDILAMTYQFLNRAAHAPSETAMWPASDGISLIWKSTDVLVQSIEAIFNRIAAEVAKAVGLVRILTAIIHLGPELTIHY